MSSSASEDPLPGGTSLVDLLRSCTIRVIVGGTSGTGFFVAPGLVLTCAHVVEQAQVNRSPIILRWRSIDRPGELVGYAEKPYPDLALVRIDLQEHPCVLLGDEIGLDDRIYSFGYPTDYAGGDSATFIYEGPALEPSSNSLPPIELKYIKLKEGQAPEGFSGSPLLNRRTGRVCGILKRSRGTGTDLGGRGVPVSTILQWRPELRELQREYHSAHSSWAKLAELPYLLGDVLPLRISGARLNNLPPVGAVLGRERDIADATKQLVAPGVRLLTITGPGGVGKSAIALRVATDVWEQFANGACWVDLESISDPSLVASTIAHSLTVMEAGLSIEQALCQSVDDRQLLLVLDHFEHLLGAAGLLTKLLSACPRLKVLVTSEADLNIGAETIVAVGPLALPDPQRLPPLDRLLEYGAVELFVDRAKALQPSFTLTEENAADVVAICDHLDGLPLAIVLAAGRIRARDPRRILEELNEQPWALLARKAPDLPPREQTMRAAMEWSYGLLSDENEKILFRRLAVFVRGCTTDMVEAVCRMPGGADLLELLVSKSLLQSTEQKGQGLRFQMLATVRAYARELLDASGEAAELQRRHAECYLRFAQLAEPKLTGAEQEAGLDQLEAEILNLRAATAWFKGAGDVDEAMTLASCLWQFWYRRSYFRDGRKWLIDILSLPGNTARTALRAKVLNDLGNLFYNQCEYAEAESRYQESHCIRRELNDQGAVAGSLNNLGLVARQLGNYLRAHRFLMQAIKINTKLQNLVQHRNWLAINLDNLGNVLHDQMINGQARIHLERSLALFAELQDVWGVAMALCDLADIDYDEGDYEAAYRKYSDSLTSRRDLRESRGQARSLGGLGHVAQSRRDFRAAEECYKESLTLHRGLGDRLGIAESLEDFAGLAAAQGIPEQAHRLASRAARLRQELRAPLSPAAMTRLESWLQPTRQMLDAEAIAKLRLEGSALSLEQALVLTGLPA